MTSSAALVRRSCALLGLLAFVAAGVHLHLHGRPDRSSDGALDLRGLERGAAPRPAADRHLAPWEEYLAMSGSPYVPPLDVAGTDGICCLGACVDCSRSALAEHLLEVCYVQLGARAAAWIRPLQGEAVADPQHPAGGLFAEGDVFRLFGAREHRVEVVEVGLAEVAVQLAGDPATRVSLANTEFEVDAAAAGVALDAR